MAYNKKMTSSQEVSAYSSSQSLRFGSETDSEKVTLGSSNSNPFYKSESSDINEMKDWTSSMGSLNKYSVSMTKLSTSNERIELMNHIDEEDKSDDFERDLDMDTDEGTFALEPKHRPIRKRLSLRKRREDVELERIVYEDEDYRHPDNENFEELQDDNFFHKPLGKLRLRKLKSDILSDESSSFKFSSVLDSDREICLFERDLNRISKPMSSPDSPKKRDTK